MILLASNNATSTLAGPISPSSTALNVQSGAGAEFPSPGANQYFTVTLNDASTGLLVEIMWCTNVTGDTLTVQRGKEGTTAQSWLANDLVGNFWTAGSMAAMAQQGQLQSNLANQAPDVGSVNALVASLTPAPASFAGVAGALLTITGIVASNTGAVTLNLNGLGAQSVINPNDTALSPGQLTTGSIAVVVWSVSQSAFVLVSTSTASSPAVPYINTSAGAYAVPIPAGMTRGKATIVGPGGGGGGCDGTHNTGGGGAGGICIKYFHGLVPGQTIAGFVGSGGAGGTSGVSGTAGSTATTLQVNGTGTVYTANPGGGGEGGTTAPSGAIGGTATNGDINLQGGTGFDGDNTSVNAPAGSGAPGYLGAGGGKASENGGSAANATSFGAGGGGSYIASSSGGSGFGGLIVVEWSP